MLGDILAAAGGFRHERGLRHTNRIMFYLIGRKEEGGGQGVGNEKGERESDSFHEADLARLSTHKTLQPVALMHAHTD